MLGVARSFLLVYDYRNLHDPGDRESRWHNIGEINIFLKA